METAHTTEDRIKEIKLKAAGFSSRAIAYYLDKVHMGEIPNPTVCYAYKGPCGDTIKFYLVIKDEKILEVKFQVEGCPGAVTAASALSEMIQGKSIAAIKNITAEDIIRHLGGFPESKRDCIHLAKTSLEKTLQSYSKLLNLKHA
jgi:nitrogen fixation NifU-like protein